jgi:hypothetical protein
MPQTLCLERLSVSGAPFYSEITRPNVISDCVST